MVGWVVEWWGVGVVYLLYGLMYSEISTIFISHLQNSYSVEDDILFGHLFIRKNPIPKMNLFHMNTFFLSGEEIHRILTFQHKSTEKRMIFQQRSY